MSQHTLSVLVENKPSVLARVSLLLARRGFNIHSMAVGPTADEGLSRMTIVVDAPELEQVKKQLHKLVNVVRITELDPDESLEREIMMIRVAATAGKRGEILEIGTIFKATAIDVGSTSIAFTVGGEPRKINEVQYQTVSIDVSEMSTSDQIRAAIKALGGDGDCAGAITRVVLTGQPEQDLDIDRDALLHTAAQDFRYLDIVNRTDPPFDLEQIQDESTTRGAFVRMLHQQLAQAPESERAALQNALYYGLRAFAGQEIRRR